MENAYEKKIKYQNSAYIMVISIHKISYIMIIKYI